MPLSPGDKLGPYEILAPLGAGGMGEVYRARDSKLRRDVAIKVLPSALANDAQYMARFEREAQLLAALNHPNIATVYGIEQGALVMELVEGADLKSPLPLEEAIAIARQIAAGLEAAHEKGIVHRDLKPANIKLTPAGTIKLLDFGLAKATEASPATNSTQSPTMSLAMTQAGMIMGTAAYMSPEQARGKPVDKRADIWAFGVILYELLTGRDLFGGGETVSDALAAVITREPDLSVVPEQVRPLLQACLEKDPRKRLRDIGDWQRLLVSAPVPTSGPSPSQRPALWIGACAALAIALATVVVVPFREAPAERELIRFAVLPPEGGSFQQALPALSPDGRKLVFSAAAKGTTASTLWVRSLDTLELTLLPGTEGAVFPFWSPDGRFVGFWQQGKERRVDLLGSPPQDICDVLKLAASGNGYASWGRDGFIYLSAGGSGLFRVPQAGGEAVQIAPPDRTKGEMSYFYPQVLPDEKHLLYHVFQVRREENAAWVTTLDGKQRKRLVLSPQATVFVPAQGNAKVAHLLFMRQDTLMAQPLDPGSYEPSGDAFAVVKGVGSSTNYAHFTASPNGALAYRTGGNNSARELQWFDRTGKMVSTVGSAAAYLHVALSRDGTRIALVQQDERGGNRDLWTVDTARSTFTRFTFIEGTNADGVWSPDGQFVAFSSRKGGHLDHLYLKDSSGAKPEEPLLEVKDGDGTDRPYDWSQDGRYLLFVRTTQAGQGIWTLSGPAGDPSQRKVASYLGSSYALNYPQFAPGPHAPRWVSYTSDESRRSTEVFVQSFPASGAKFQISNGGGTQPRWRRDGKELFYLTPDGKLMAVDVKIGDGFQAGTPHLLFDTHDPTPSVNNMWRYDVSPDGQRFLFHNAVKSEARGQEYITVVTNWLAGVNR